MSSAADLRASVVICAWSDERWDEVRAAVRSVIEQTRPALEIILVVDHNQGLAGRLATAFPSVTVIPNSESRGLSGARNSGVTAARGDIVTFLDDDAVAPAGWLAGLLAHYGNPEVAAVGGAAEPHWPADRPQWLPYEFDWVVGCSYRGQPGEPRDVRNLLGCNMSARRSLIEAAGGFNDGLGRTGNDAAGGEETELCITIRRQNPGSRIVYDPSIVVRHFVSPSRTRWAYFRARCLAEGRSKARLSAMVGPDDGLSAERSYTARILPRGVRDGLADAALRGDVWGIVRSANIVAGLSFAAWGYAGGRLRRSATAQAPAFRPLRVVEIELDDPLPTIDDRNPETGTQYGGALCLVRRGGEAMGVVELPSLPARVTTELLGELAAPTGPPALRPIAIGADAPPVTVVVATRDRAESLARCLDSLLRQDYGAFDIVVADSAPSSTQSADLIHQRYRETGRVRYTRTERPGLGHAHNSGMALVSSPVAAFTDDDVIADRRWLRAIAEDFGSDSKVGCVTGLIMPAELETRAQLWTERHGAFGKGFRKLTFELGQEGRGPLFPYTAGQFGSGANMAFLTEALRRIDGFDPALGAGTRARGGDDLLAFFRVIKAGYRLIYEPQAIVWHYHRRSEDGMRRQAFGYGMGLGAYLTRVAVDRPDDALRLARALPAGIRHMWGSKSERVHRLPEDYPNALVWRERFGVMAGPVGYMLSRLAGRAWNGNETGGRALARQSKASS